MLCGKHVVGMILAAEFIGMFTSVVHAQNAHGNHAQLHAHYQSWMNKLNNGCCNDKDCDTLSDSRERSTGNGDVEVLVYGVGAAEGKSAWCKVDWHHYLLSGNAPNWSTAHICVSDYYYKGSEPCPQFICYQPKPKI